VDLGIKRVQKKVQEIKRIEKKTGRAAIISTTKK
jgi:hypothetical protein